MPRHERNNDAMDALRYMAEDIRRTEEVYTSLNGETAPVEPLSFQRMREAANEARRQMQLELATSIERQLSEEQQHLAQARATSLRYRPGAVIWADDIRRMQEEVDELQNQRINNRMLGQFPWPAGRNVATPPRDCSSGCSHPEHQAITINRTEVDPARPVEYSRGIRINRRLMETDANFQEVLEPALRRLWSEPFRDNNNPFVEDVGRIAFHKEARYQLTELQKLQHGPEHHLTECFAICKQQEIDFARRYEFRVETSLDALMTTLVIIQKHTARPWATGDRLLRDWFRTNVLSESQVAVASLPEFLHPNEET